MATMKLEPLRMENMRPLTTGGYGAVGNKQTLKAFAGWMPLCRLNDGGREVWLFGRGRELAGGTLADTYTPLPFESDTPGDVTGAIATGAASAIVICRKGALKVTVTNGVWTASSITNTYPAVTFRAVTAAAATAQVGDRKLSTHFTGGSTLTDSERRVLCSDLGSAYRSACTEAASAGLFTAPVVLWCRYLDKAGRELLETPAVIVRPAADFNPWAEATVQDGQTVKGYTLSVPACGIEAELEGKPCGEVAAVEIWCTPCLHPYRADGPASVTLSRESTFRISVPGHDNSLISTGEGTMERVLRILGAAKNMGRCVLTVNRPFGSTATTATIHHPDPADPAEEGKLADTALRSKITRTGTVEALLRSPHSFGADSMACDASSLILGGINVVRSRGYSPLFFASQLGDTGGNKARALVTVTFANAGTGVVLAEEFDRRMPLNFGSVLSYPAADATTMRLTVFDGTTTYSRAFTLTPDSTGRSAVYIEPGLKPITLPAVSATAVVDVTELSDTYPCLIAACATSNPLCPAATLNLSANISEIAACGGADASWEFGRSRFAAISNEGLLSIATAKDCTTLSVKTLDRRTPRALCPAPGGVYAALPGGVVEISTAGRSCRTILDGDYTSLAWDNTHRELMAFGTDGCTVLCRDSNQIYYRPDYAGAKGIAASGVQFIYRNELELAHLESYSATSTVRMDAVADAGGRNIRPRALCLNGYGWLEEAELNAGFGGADIAKLNFSGSVKRPLVMPLLCRGVPRVTVSFSADTDDFTFYNLKIQEI